MQQEAQAAKRVREDYRTICYYQTSFPLEVAPALQKFDDKWRNALKEVEMANYIKREWSTKRWQRAYGPPGEPTDNNTLESLNCVLKGDENFSASDILRDAA